MRKFRAWSKGRNEYISQDQIHQLYLRMDGRVFWHAYDGFEDVTDKIDIEFSTGHPDIDGQEVYDGDKVDFFGCSTREYTGHLPTRCKVVWFEESSGWMLDDMDGKHSYGLYKSSIVKVIGHIHEQEAAANEEDQVNRAESCKDA